MFSVQCLVLSDNHTKAIFPKTDSGKINISAVHGLSKLETSLLISILRPYTAFKIYIK